MPSRGSSSSDAIVLALHVQPGAARTEVAGVHGDAIKIRLAAPPVEGKANLVLRRFLAEAFDVPLRNVEIVRGDKSREKRVRIVAPMRRPEWYVAGLPTGGGSKNS